METTESNGEEKYPWTIPRLYLDYAGNLSILNESLSKMYESLEVLRNQGARIGLKINVKKTKSLRLGISEDEKATLGNKMIDQVLHFPW